MTDNRDRHPYAGFGGTVKRELSRSTPWWPTGKRPPQDAPNVVIVLADDLGYSDIGCFGSEIPDAAHRLAGAVRCAVHVLSFPALVFADTGVASNRPRVSHRRLRVPGPVRSRVPRLRHGTAQRCRERG